MTAAIIDEQLQAKVDYYRRQGEAICSELSKQINKLLPEEECLLPVFSDAEFTQVIDPYTLQVDLNADWLSAGRRRGQIRFHSDGSFYAEYDVLQPHPAKSSVFIEAIHAWGRDDVIKSEARLLDLPQDVI